jgi:hypothetical protein
MIKTISNHCSLTVKVEPGIVGAPGRRGLWRRHVLHPLQLLRLHNIHVRELTDQLCGRSLLDHVFRGDESISVAGIRITLAPMVD